jgi:hypothetical protein
MDTKDCILFSGGARGAEAVFGSNAERLGIEEVNLTFEGHSIVRDRGIRVLNHEELKKGDVSLTYISKLLNRNYTRTEVFRKILQSIWYQINNGQEIYVVGQIQEDNTVRGGTGWGAEFAKLCNKPLYVFDQEQDGWFVWSEDKWVAEAEPRIQHPHFTGTGTRLLKDNSEKAIAELFDRSFA